MRAGALLSERGLGGYPVSTGGRGAGVVCAGACGFGCQLVCVCVCARARVRACVHACAMHMLLKAVLPYLRHVCDETCVSNSAPVFAAALMPPPVPALCNTPPCSTLLLYVHRYWLHGGGRRAGGASGEFMATPSGLRGAWVCVCVAALGVDIPLNARSVFVACYTATWLAWGCSGCMLVCLCDTDGIVCTTLYRWSWRV
jgi:hypothetical protein